MCVFMGNRHVGFKSSPSDIRTQMRTKLDVHVKSFSIEYLVGIQSILIPLFLFTNNSMVILKIWSVED